MSRPQADLRPWIPGEPVEIVTLNLVDEEPEVLAGEVLTADDTVVLVDVGLGQAVGFWAWDGTDSVPGSHWILRRPQ